MSVVKLKYAPREKARSICFLSEEDFGEVKSFLEQYDVVKQFEVDDEVDSEELCDDLFDLLNNPMRQPERECFLPRQRSMSVGDIVEINGVNHICMSIGWGVL